MTYRPNHPGGHHSHQDQKRYASSHGEEPPVESQQHELVARNADQIEQLFRKEVLQEDNEFRHGNL